MEHPKSVTAPKSMNRESKPLVYYQSIKTDILVNFRICDKIVDLEERAKRKSHHNFSQSVVLLGSN